MKQSMSNIINNGENNEKRMAKAIMAWQKYLSMKGRQLINMKSK